MATKKLPAMYKKLVAVKLTQKFREAAKLVSAELQPPAPNEVVIKNRYLGINASDINMTAGRYFTSSQPPFDLGFEGVGEVVMKGDQCDDIKIGQPVAYMNFGAFADFVTINKHHAIPVTAAKPEVIPCLVSGLTAAISLDKVGEIKPDDKVLVTAAAGGTGQFAVQWAKKSGCHVIGTCSTDEKVDLLKRLGCDRPINTSKENLRDIMKGEYSSGVNVVYESVGGDVFDTCVDSLANKGKVIVIGYVKGYEMDAGFAKTKTATLPPKLLAKSASIRGFMLFQFTEHYKEYLGKLFQSEADGSIKALVDNGVNHSKGPFKGLASITDAVEYLYTRKSRGKIYVELPE